MEKPHLIGHRLCPYVQRVLIVLREKALPFDYTAIDLDAKPAWLTMLSPSGKVPALRISPDVALFESAVIAEYLDETSGGGLTPADPVDRARRRAWMRIADHLLGVVARIIYRDQDQAAMEASLREIETGLAMVAATAPPRPYLGGGRFELIDATYATLFRFFETLDRLSTVRLAPRPGSPFAEWWAEIRARPSVSAAAPSGYTAELTRFIAERDSAAGRLLRA